MGLLLNVKCFGDISWNFKYDATNVKGIIIQANYTEYIQYDTIVIPDSIVNKNISRPVVSIDQNAFKNCSTLKHIVLPKHLKIINQNAFLNCSSLKTISLPNTLTTINKSAFYNCSSLDSIFIPNTVKTLDNTVFGKCTNLKVIELPTSISTIPTSFFYNCSSLEIITLPNNCTTINKGAFSNCNNLSHINLNNVSNIGDSAFINCISLDSVIILNDVITLGKKTFENCTNLKHIELSDSLKEIPEYLLYKCISLDSIKIPENCININKDAFAYCSNLTNIRFNNNLISIGDSAFKNCSNLKRINLPENIDSISKYCFTNCTLLDSVILPQSTRKLGSYCFDNCSSLSYIKLNENLKGNLIGTFKNTKIEGFTVPKGVSSLYSSAIEKCDGLRYIIMSGGPITCNCTSPDCSKIGETYIYNIIINKPNYTNTFIKGRYFQQYLAHSSWGITHTYVPIDSLCCNYYTHTYFTIPFSYHADTLLLLQGRDASSSKFNIVKDATYYADNGIGVHFKINNKRFYYFSLPFNCAISDIRKNNNIVPTFGSDFIIKKHDGARVAKYGYESTISSNKEKYGWVTLSANDTLYSGQGYIIATSTAENETYYFITHDSIQLNYIHSYSSDIPTPLHNVNVVYHNDNSTNPAYHGWNLISSGLLYDITNHDLYLNDEKINYISIPDSIGKKYYQSEVKDAKILPYRSFLVQVSDTGIINFRKSTSNVYSSMINENRVIISLNSVSSQLDKTTLIINDDYSVQYEYNKDLMKFIGSDCPQIYTITNGIDLCFNALPDSAVFQPVLLGLNIPDTTQYYNISLENITFDRNKYSLYLVDNNYNITVNLNEIINYTFKTDNNKEDDRFMIYLQERVIDNESANYTNNVNWFVQGDKLYFNNINPETIIHIYSIDGKLIFSSQYNNGIDKNIIPKGVYFVQIGNNNLIKIAI